MRLSSFRLALLALALGTTASQGQGITQPRVPSPAATVAQTIGISTVTVAYSRPSVRGRAIWGALVPYGWNKQGFGLNNDAPWRAGANENTVITFSHPVKVEGHDVPAGSYGLFFVINADNSGEVVLSKEHRSWGSFFYDPTQDELRAPIQTKSIPKTETLTYEFLEVSKNSGTLALEWETKQFPVKIEFATDQIVMDNAVQELKNTVGFSWEGYSSAAEYALQNKTDLDRAMGWIDRAIAMNKNFQTLAVKSGLLRLQGKTADADQVMNGAVEIANENELNNYGYQMLNQGKQDKAIELLTLNTKRHPESANTWDSLGEAYALKGDKKNAITNFKKSLSLNPPANVRANSEKYLTQLGAN